MIIRSLFDDFSIRAIEYGSVYIQVKLKLPYNKTGKRYLGDAEGSKAIAAMAIRKYKKKIHF